MLTQLTEVRQQGLKQYTKNILLSVSIVLFSVNSAFAQTCHSNISASTPTARFTPQGDGTVLDTQTKLIWKRCLEGQTWNGANKSCDGTASSYTWQEALNVPQGNWRVPNIKELSSIVEISCFFPAINLTVFPEDLTVYPFSADTILWSSSPIAGSSEVVWGVYFGIGYNDVNEKTNNNRLRLVREL